MALNKTFTLGKTTNKQEKISDSDKCLAKN